MMYYQKKKKKNILETRGPCCAEGSAVVWPIGSFRSLCRYFPSTIHGIQLSLQARLHYWGWPVHVSCEKFITDFHFTSYFVFKPFKCLLSLTFFIFPDTFPPMNTNINNLLIQVVHAWHLSSIPKMKEKWRYLGIWPLISASMLPTCINMHV